MALQLDEIAFRKVLASANNNNILSGAGLSVGSGIPTFKGPTADSTTWKTSKKARKRLTIWL